MDRGEGQQWNLAPGNLYSTPQKINLITTKTATFEILLDRMIPPIEPAKDTKYIKHVKIQSERLTKFWGRPMYLGAHVLLPEGFDEHPKLATHWSSFTVTFHTTLVASAKHRPIQI